VLNPPSISSGPLKTIGKWKRRDPKVSVAAFSESLFLQWERFYGLFTSFNYKIRIIIKINSLLKRSLYNILRSSIAFNPNRYNLKMVLRFIAFNLYLNRGHTKQIAAYCEASTTDRIRGNNENIVNSLVHPRRFLKLYNAKR
jgi:hypothetical protein